MGLGNLLRNLAGKPPRFPAGTTYLVDTQSGSDFMHATGVAQYVVRAQLPGTDAKGPRVSPTFSDYVEASRYADCMTRGVAYEFPAGKAI